MFSIYINRRQQKSHAFETFFQKMRDLSCKFYVTTYMQDASTWRAKLFFKSLKIFLLTQKKK
jgi:hypothetical protein